MTKMIDTRAGWHNDSAERSQRAQEATLERKARKADGKPLIKLQHFNLRNGLDLYDQARTLNEVEKDNFVRILREGNIDSILKSKVIQEMKLDSAEIEDQSEVEKVELRKFLSEGGIEELLDEIELGKTEEDRQREIEQQRKEEEKKKDPSENKGIMERLVEFATGN